MLQKVIKVGNSIAVTLPKDFARKTRLRPGDEVLVEPEADIEMVTVTTKRAKRPRSPITPEFLDWLESFNKKYGPALKELAKK